MNKVRKNPTNSIRDDVMSNQSCCKFTYNLYVANPLLNLTGVFLSTTQNLQRIILFISFLYSYRRKVIRQNEYGQTEKVVST